MLYLEPGERVSFQSVEFTVGAGGGTPAAGVPVSRLKNRYARD